MSQICYQTGVANRFARNSFRSHVIDNARRQLGLNVATQKRLGSYSLGYPGGLATNTDALVI